MAATVKPNGDEKGIENAKGALKAKEIKTYWSTTERGMKAEDKLAEFPYDTDSWGVLLREAQTYPMEMARVLYERIVKLFPTAGRYWKLYIEQESRNKNFENVEKLFQRCLVKILNIDLWKCYLTYVKDTKQNLPNFREKMIQAYEFAVEKIGLDFQSYPIWQEYISFLKSGDAVGAYAENQKILAIRKVYQRAVITPMQNIEALWKEYQAYEQSINKNLAEKLIHDRTWYYMNARRCSREYQTNTATIVRGLPSVPPQGTLHELKQKESWKKYISWEKKNPLRSDDTNVVIRRVLFAYEQCLLSLGFHPDVWYEAALFLECHSKAYMEKGDMQASQKLADEVAAIYDRATTTTLKNSELLHFAYAEFEESRKRFQKVHEIYDKLLQEDMDPTLTYVQYMKFCRRAEGIKESRNVFKRAREDPRSNYQVYTAAALQENYCNKDGKVAANIFELGLKKYNNEPGYAVSYLDHKIHLNEDNNTRVLFERILNGMTKEISGDVLHRYLQFESQFGDLSSILKIDRRLVGAMDEEYEDKDTVALIDRYKFMDLTPVTPSEMKSIDFKNVACTTGQLQTETQLSAPVDPEKPSQYAKPDLSQMKPFKPVTTAMLNLGPQVAPGGVFPPPPAALQVLSILPPPSCFHGPFVIVDELINSILNCKLVEPQANKNAVVANGVDEDGDRKGMKRHFPEATGDDSDDETVAPPVHDIYRMRQQKRVHVS